MLIPVLDIAGKQMAWIDHLKLEEGNLFRSGKRVFRLAEDGTLIEVAVGEIDPADFMDVAANDESA